MARYRLTNITSGQNRTVTFYLGRIIKPGDTINIGRVTPEVVDGLAAGRFALQDNDGTHFAAEDFEVIELFEPLDPDVAASLPPESRKPILRRIVLSRSEAANNLSLVVTDDRLRGLLGTACGIYLVSDLRMRRDAIALPGEGLADASGLQLAVSARKIDLSSNELDRFVSIQTLRSLESLNLSFNNLRSLEGGNGLALLREIELQGNELFEVELPTRMDTLRLLDVSANAFSSQGLSGLVGTLWLNRGDLRRGNPVILLQDNSPLTLDAKDQIEGEGGFLENGLKQTGALVVYSSADVPVVTEPRYVAVPQDNGPWINSLAQRFRVVVVPPGFHRIASIYEVVTGGTLSEFVQAKALRKVDDIEGLAQQVSELAGDLTAKADKEHDHEIEEVDELPEELIRLIERLNAADAGIRGTSSNLRTLAARLANLEDVVNIQLANEGQVVSPITFSFLQDRTGRPVPAGGADAVLIKPWGAFDFSPVIKEGRDTTITNSYVDGILTGRLREDWRADIYHLIEQDLAPISTVETVVLAAPWYALFGGANVPDHLVPLVMDRYVDVAPLLSDPGEWYAAGSDVADTVRRLREGASVRSTPDTRSLVRGVHVMQEHGYRAGIAVDVYAIEFLDSIPAEELRALSGALEYSEALNSATRPVITSLGGLQRLVQSHRSVTEHYIAVCQEQGVVPDEWIMGMGLSRLIGNADETVGSEVVAGLMREAELVREAFPDISITYVGAKDQEALHRLADRLYSHPDVDAFGSDARFPLTVEHETRPDALSQGFRSGIGWSKEPSRQDESSSQRFLRTTRGRGRRDVLLEDRSPATAAKNVFAQYRDVHYVPFDIGSSSAGDLLDVPATPLAGTLPQHEPSKLRDVDLRYFMSSRFVTRKQGLDERLRYGYALLEKGRTGPAGNLPSFSGELSALRMSMTVQLDEEPFAGDTSAVLVNVAGCFQLIHEETENTRGIRLLPTRDIGTQDQNVVPLSIPKGTVELEIDVVTDFLTLSLTINGTTFVYSGPLALPPSGGAFRIGDGDGMRFPGRLFYLDVRLQGAVFVGTEGAPTERTFGGYWTFEERGIGTPTTFRPGEHRPVVMIGGPSIHGASVEPSYEPFVEYRLQERVDDDGEPPAIPPFYRDKPFAEFVREFGYYLDNVEGPYGSLMHSDEVHQLRLIESQGRYARSLVESSGREGMVIASFLDARPASICMLWEEAAPAPDTGEQRRRLIFPDAPQLRISSALNGKLAGGGTLVWSELQRVDRLDRIVAFGDVDTGDIDDGLLDDFRSAVAGIRGVRNLQIGFRAGEGVTSEASTRLPTTTAAFNAPSSTIVFAPSAAGFGSGGEK